MEKIEGGRSQCSKLTTADAIVAGVAVGVIVAGTIFTGGILGGVLAAFGSSLEVTEGGMLAADVACYIAA